jgi:hypothetical protein
MDMLSFVKEENASTPQKLVAKLFTKEELANFSSFEVIRTSTYITPPAPSIVEQDS